MVEEEFNKYVSNYDLNNLKVLGKYKHSLRVMELSLKYSRLLGFSEEEIEIAKVIGLLHDFGRFEQIRIYDSFNDLETVDHADESAYVLFEKGEIKKFYNNEEKYSLIEFAIRNHNKKEVAECHSEEVLKQTYLIRDMDKIDIMKAISEELKTEPDDSEISKEVLDCIYNHITVDRSVCKTKNDRIATQYAFAFDIHYDIGLKEFKDNFISFHKKINGDRMFHEIYSEVIKYLDERIDNYERNSNKV